MLKISNMHIIIFIIAISILLASFAYVAYNIFKIKQWLDDYKQTQLNKDVEEIYNTYKYLCEIHKDTPIQNPTINQMSDYIKKA